LLPQWAMEGGIAAARLVMASDGCASSGSDFKGFSLSLMVANEVEADRTFAALADRGQVTMPHGKTLLRAAFRSGNPAEAAALAA
jgi:uncharacterized glyoxalase superfamily protein PhnB